MLDVHDCIAQGKFSLNIGKFNCSFFFQQMMFMICPHLLAEQDVKSPRFDPTLNQIDPSIFKTRNKSSKQKKAEK